MLSVTKVVMTKRLSFFLMNGRFLVVVLMLLVGCQRTPEQDAVRTANAFLKNNQLSAAMTAVESCLKQHPDSIELLRLRVLILLRANQLDEAATALSGLPADDPVIAQALHHRDPMVRAGAAKLIADLSLPISCRVLIGGMDDAMPEVRRYCARALGGRQNCHALRPLYRALQDDNWFVRAEAADALGKLGDPQAAGWLYLCWAMPMGLFVTPRPSRCAQSPARSTRTFCWKHSDGPVAGNDWGSQQPWPNFITLPRWKRSSMQPTTATPICAARRRRHWAIMRLSR